MKIGDTVRVIKVNYQGSTTFLQKRIGKIGVLVDVNSYINFPCFVRFSWKEVEQYDMEEIELV